MSDAFLFNPRRVIVVLRLCVCVVSLMLLSFLLIPDFLTIEENYIYPISKNKNKYFSKKQALPEKMLFLRPFMLTTPFPKINDEAIVFLKQNRPDYEGKKCDIKIQIRGSNEKRKLNLKEKFYLKKENGSNYKFSDNKSYVFITPLLVKNNRVTFSLGANYNELNNFVKNTKLEKKETLEAVVERNNLQDIEKKQWILLTQQAKFLGQDRALEKLDKEKEKVRIEFKRAGGTDLLKVQKGDILFLEKDRWHRAENLKETQNHELVKIKEISSREMKLEAWDKEGNINFLFSIYSPKIEALKRKAESVIQSVHLYSKGRVSCKLDRQRLLLKVGDWLILKKNRWHRIDKIDAYEKLSCSDNFGELLFFEKIEKRQNKNFLKGWVFNNIRTQTFNFEILIISSSSKPKRREISSINKNFFSSSDFQRGKL